MFSAAHSRRETLFDSGFDPILRDISALPCFSHVCLIENAISFCEQTECSCSVFMVYGKTLRVLQNDYSYHLFLLFMSMTSLAPQNSWIIMNYCISYQFQINNEENWKVKKKERVRIRSEIEGGRNSNRGWERNVWRIRKCPESAKK